MTNLINTFAKAALVGVAAFAVIACAREAEIPNRVGNDEEDGPVKTIQFRALSSATKAAFGTSEGNSWPTLWTSNDHELKLSMNYCSAIAAAVTPSDDYLSATFSASIDFTGLVGPFTYYAVSPSSAAKALSPSREAWKVTIPCEQTPASGSPDEGALILASASAEYTTASEAEVIDLYFGHLTAYGCMSLGNLALKQDETVSSVELTVTTPIAGDWFWKCSDAALTDYGASGTLTIHTSATENIWFGCAPVEVGDEALVVSVYTNQGVYEQMKAFPKGSKFTAGEAAIFTVDMDGAEYTSYSEGTGSGSGDFVLVTSESSLSVGDEVLIVYTAGSKALGGVNSSGNFRDPVDITISSGSIASSGSAAVLTLEEGNNEGTWAFRDGSYYIASSSSGNYLKNSSTKTDNATWTVEIAGSGLATVAANSGASTYLSYNTSSPRFTCYSNTNQKQVSIYRRSGGSSSVGQDPLLEHTEYGCYLGGGSEWEYAAGTNQVSRSYNQYGYETYTLINPSTVEELEITGYKKGYVKGDGNISIAVNWRRGSETVLSDNYTMKIIKEAGPKVWLSNGNGKGVIIKK